MGGIHRWYGWYLGIIGNIHNNIVVIYEIKSFYVSLAAGKIFPNNIHRANYHFTHSKKLKKTDNTTVLLLGGIVYRKRPQHFSLWIANHWAV
jgi:hypothetical protein